VLPKIEGLDESYTELIEKEQPYEFIVQEETLNKLLFPMNPDRNYPYLVGDCFYNAIDYLRLNGIVDLKKESDLKWNVMMKLRRRKIADWDLSKLRSREWVDYHTIWVITHFNNINLVIVADQYSKRNDGTQISTIRCLNTYLYFTNSTETVYVINYNGSHYWPNRKMSFKEFIDHRTAMDQSSIVKLNKDITQYHLDLKNAQAMNNKIRRHKSMTNVDMKASHPTKIDYQVPLAEFNDLMMRNSFNRVVLNPIPPDRKDLIKTGQCVDKAGYDKFNIHPMEMENGESIKMLGNFENLNTTMTYDEVKKIHPCDKHHTQPVLLALLPKAQNRQDNMNTIYYTDCIANTLTTAKRMLERKPIPLNKMGEDYLRFVDEVYMPPIIDKLEKNSNIVK